MKPNPNKIRSKWSPILVCCRQFIRPLMAGLSQPLAVCDVYGKLSLQLELRGKVTRNKIKKKWHGASKATSSSSHRAIQFEQIHSAITPAFGSVARKPPPHSLKPTIQTIYDQTVYGFIAELYVVYQLVLVQHTECLFFEKPSKSRCTAADSDNNNNK